MINQKYLHEKIREMRLNDSWYRPLPNFITDNLNQNFELRGYQIEAIRNFISYFEDTKLSSWDTLRVGIVAIMIALAIIVFWCVLGVIL